MEYISRHMEEQILKLSGSYPAFWRHLINHLCMAEQFGAFGRKNLVAPIGMI